MRSLGLACASRFDDHEGGGVVGFVGDADVRLRPRASNQSASSPCSRISGLPLRALTISQARQVIGMRMPRPIAFENASLAEKRVAR